MRRKTYWYSVAIVKGEDRKYTRFATYSGAKGWIDIIVGDDKLACRWAIMRYWDNLPRSVIRYRWPRKSYALRPYHQIHSLVIVAESSDYLPF